jgi:hypothetical protein
MPPSTRVMDMLTQMDTIIEEHNCQTEVGIQNWVRLAAEFLQPYLFRNQMLDLIDFSKHKLKDNQSLFVDQLLSDVSKFESEVSRILANSAMLRMKQSGAFAQKRPMLNKCLKCHQKGHVMKDCHLKPSAEEQSKLLKQHQALKKANKSNKSSTYMVIARIVDSDGNASKNENRVEVTFAEGQIVCQGILDGGADAIMIPKNIANKIRQIDESIACDIYLTPLSPTEVELPDGKLAEIYEELDIDITF